MEYTTPFWNYPPELQGRCRVLAGSAWIVFAVFYLGSWGLAPVILVCWALPAMVTAFLMVLWVRHHGVVREVAASLLLLCCVVAFVVLTLESFHRMPPLPDTVAWVPLGLCLWGAVLGFFGRPGQSAAAA